MSVRKIRSRAVRKSWSAAALAGALAVSFPLGDGFAISRATAQTVGAAGAAASVASIESILDAAKSDPVKYAPLLKTALESAVRGRPTDPLPWFAATTVHLKFGRLKEAEEAIDKALTVGPEHVPSLQAKARIAMLRREHRSALAALEKLGPIAAKDGIPADRQEAVGTFAGRALAFLKGPSARLVKPAEVDQVVDQLNSTWSGDLQKAFAANFRDGMLELTGGVMELDKTREEEKAKDAEKKAENLAKLGEEQSENAKRAEELSEARSKLESTHRQELANVENSIMTVQPQYATAVRSVQELTRQAQLIEANLNQAQNSLNNAETQQERNLYLNEVNRLRNQRGLATNSLGFASQDARRLEAQLATLLGQRNALLNRFAVTQKQIRDEELKVIGAGKRIDRDARKNSESPTGENARTIAAKRRLDSFGGFDPFSFDRERDLILAGFRLGAAGQATDAGPVPVPPPAAPKPSAPAPEPGPGDSSF